MINSDRHENLRKRINVRLVNNETDFLKYTSRPTHITHKIFGQNYAAIHEIKPVLMLNKPIYVGFTVLELSKCMLMYDFHYRFIKKHFDAELLLFTDNSNTIKQNLIIQRMACHKNPLQVPLTIRYLHQK